MMVPLRQTTRAAFGLWLAGTLTFADVALAQAPISVPAPVPSPVPQSVKPAQSPLPQSIPALETAAPSDSTTPEIKPVTDPIVIDTLRAMAGQKAQGPLAGERELLAALETIYSARNRPFWTARSGYLPAARAVIDELGRAGDWGLNSAAFKLAPLADTETSPEAVGAAELALSFAVIKYAWHARGGRIDPTALSLWLDSRARPIDVAEVLTRTAASNDPAEVLRKLHPQHPQFALLRSAYLQARGGMFVQPVAAPAKTFAPIPSGPLLKPGASHPHIVLVRQRLEVAAKSNDPDYYDDALADAVRGFLKQAGLSGSTQIGAKARAAFNRQNQITAAPKPATNEATAKRILANMERWRWLPEDLGRTHVWNNLPEFETRVVKDGKVVHQERIIIGKAETQTPVFSDAMRVVVFQPDWGVPNSIKIKDLLPKLQDGDEDVLDRKGMRIAVNGRTVDPGKFNWDKVDIRTIPIVQDPGPSNPLGQIKFLFPNKHDVYMHDTPSKHLFNEATRTFSHGCIRVRNPRKFAEVVFSEDQGWSMSDIESRLQAKAQVNNRVPLNNRIPVHNAYFTVVASETGAVRTLNDIYGHDRRITAALDGTPVAQIAAWDPARKLARDLKEIMGDPSDSAAVVARATSPAKLKVTTAVATVRPVAATGANVTAARSALGGPVRISPAPAAKSAPVSTGSTGSGTGARWISTYNRAQDGQ